MSSNPLHLYFLEGVGFLTGRVRVNAMKNSRDFAFSKQGEEHVIEVRDDFLLYTLHNTVLSDENAFYSLGEMAFLLSLHPNNQIRIGTNHFTAQLLPNEQTRLKMAQELNDEFFEEVAQGQNKLVAFFQASPKDDHLNYFESFIEGSFAARGAEELAEDIKAIMSIMRVFTGYVNEGSTIITSLCLFSLILNNVDGSVGAQLHNFFLDVDRLIFSSNTPYTSFVYLKGAARENPGFRMRCHLPPGLDRLRIFSSLHSPDLDEDTLEEGDDEVSAWMDFTSLNKDLNRFNISEDELEDIWNTIAAIILLRELMIEGGRVDLLNPESFDTSSTSEEDIVNDVIEDVFELLHIVVENATEEFLEDLETQSKLDAFIQELYYSVWMFIQTKINLSITPSTGEPEKLSMVYYILFPCVDISQPISKPEGTWKYRDSLAIKTQSEIQAFHLGFLYYYMMEKYIEEEWTFQQEFIGRHGEDYSTEDSQLNLVLNDMKSIIADSTATSSFKREKLENLISSDQGFMDNCFSELLLEDFESNSSLLKSSLPLMSKSRSRILSNLRTQMSKWDATQVVRYAREAASVTEIVENTELYINLILSMEPQYFFGSVNDDALVQSRGAIFSDLVFLDMTYVLNRLHGVFDDDRGDVLMDSSSDEDVLGLNFSFDDMKANLIGKEEEEEEEEGREKVFVSSACDILERYNETIFTGNIAEEGTLYDIPTKEEAVQFRQMVEDDMASEILAFLSEDPRNSLSLPNVAEFCSKVNSYIEIEFLSSDSLPIEAGTLLTFRRFLHSLEVISMKIVEEEFLDGVRVEETYSKWEDRLRVLRESSVIDSMLRLVFAGHIHLDILAKDDVPTEITSRDVSIFTPQFVLEITAISMRIINRFTSLESEVCRLNCCYLVSRVNFWPIALILRQYVHIVVKREKEMLSSLHIHIASMIMIILSNIAGNRKSLSFLKSQIKDKKKRVLKVYRNFVEDIPDIFARCLGTSISIPTLAAVKNFTPIFGSVYEESGVIEKLLKNCVFGSSLYIKEAVHTIVYMMYVLNGASSLANKMLQCNLVPIFLSLVLDERKDVSMHAIYLLLSLANSSMCSKHKQVKRDASSYLSEIGKDIPKKFFNASGSHDENVVETVSSVIRKADAMRAEKLREKLIIKINES